MNKLIVANLKMNIQSPLERGQYLELFKKEIKGKKLNNCEFVFCPPFVHLEGFKSVKTKKIFLGAQNIFWEEKGSFTGEVSPRMIKNIGCEYVILGHSERRRYFCEQDSEINFKIILALKNGLQPILCVGEKKGENLDVITRQLENCLKDISRTRIENVVICYEPVWAISSNNPDHPPTSNDILSAKLMIRKFLVRKYGMKVSGKVKIIYGGSVSPDIAKDVCLSPEMDGVLIGKDSLTPYKFVKIAEIIN